MLNSLNPILDGPIEAAIAAVQALDRDPFTAVEKALEIFNNDPRAYADDAMFLWRFVDAIAAVCPAIASECIALLHEQGLDRPTPM